MISAFNRNLPYDKFVTWQIAGDLLPDDVPVQRALDLRAAVHSRVLREEESAQHDQDDSARDEPGEVRHIDHQLGADLLGDLAEGAEIDDARIGAGPGDDELETALREWIRLQPSSR